MEEDNITTISPIEKGEKHDTLINNQEVIDGIIYEIIEHVSKHKSLRAIVKNGKIKTLMTLAQDFERFVNNIDKSQWIELINLSAEEEFPEVFKELIRFESVYIKDEADNTLCKYKSIVDDVMSLHVNITKEDTENVKKLITQSKLKYYYDLNGVSAIERSIVERKFNIFATLLSNCSCDEKVLNEIEKNQNEIYQSEEKEKIFEAIVCHRAFEVLMKLMKSHEKFVANLDAEFWIKLVNLSIEKEFFEIHEELKALEKEYEKKGNVKSLEGYEKYQTVFEDISQLHNDISNGNYDKVKCFTEKYPTLKFCYHNTGDKNYCALEKAIADKKFDIYALLYSEEFKSSDSHRLSMKNKAKVETTNFTLTGMINNLTDEGREKLRDENLKLAVKNPKVYVLLLAAKFELDAASKKFSTNDIQVMLEQLYEIDEFKPIIEILALCDVKIVFDLQSEDISKSDPTRQSKVYGVTYADKGRIQIAKNINPDQLRGTFIHEATHMVLHLIYENEYLPYRVEDNKKEDEYEEIFRKTQKIVEENLMKHDDNDIVRRVFNQKQVEKKELIVRVNHLRAVFHKNSEELKKYEELYSALFEFYAQKVLPDLTKENLKIIKLNNELGIFKETVSSKFQIKMGNKSPLLDLEDNVKQNIEQFNEGSSKDISRQEKHDKFILLRNNLQKSNTGNLLVLSDVPQLTLSKLLCEISHKSSNKLHLKVKNIFIDFEKLQHINLKKELEDVTNTSEISRIIIYLKNDSSQSYEKLSKNVQENFKVLETLNSFLHVFLVVSSTSSLIIKMLYENFTIEDLKIQIKGDRTNIIEGISLTSKKVQSDIKMLQITVNHSWDELTIKSKKEVLESEIQFGNEKIALSSLFPLQGDDGSQREALHVPTSETLNILSSQTEPKIEPQSPKHLNFFIERNFCQMNPIYPLQLMHARFKNLLSHLDSDNEDENFMSSDDDEDSKYLCISVDDFLSKTKDERILVVSDVPGSGKTTLLHKIHKSLVDTHKKSINVWVRFLSLRDHAKTLIDANSIGINFFQLLSEKFFAFNELEQKIFEFKYNKDEVVILFDGFDEISPEGRKKLLNVFKLHKENNKSQIWITMRKHLEDDIGKELQVQTHKLKPLTKEQQVQFLCKYWKKSCVNKQLRKSYAERLVQKISSMIESGKDFIGITLQIELLGEYFKEYLSEKTFDARVKNLKLTDVYQFLIERGINFKEKNSYFDNALSQTRFYEAFALKYFLSKIDIPHFFGKAEIIEDLSKKELENLLKGGIISYDKDNDVFFTHLTYGEFLLARFVYNKIENFKSNWNYTEDFFKFLTAIFLDFRQQFDTVRVFLDSYSQDLLMEFEESENIKIFSESLHNFVVKNPHVINAAVCFEFSHLMYFILKCIKFIDIQTFKSIIENINWKSEAKSFAKIELEEISDLIFHKIFEDMPKSIIGIAVLKVNNEKVLEEFLDDVFDLYPVNSDLYKILMEEEEEGQTIFHLIVRIQGFTFENFKVFFSKIEKRNFKYEQMKEIFLHLSNSGKIFGEYLMMRTIKKEKEGFPSMFEEAFDLIFRCLVQVDDQRKFFDEIKLNMFGKLKNKTTFMKVFNRLREIFTSQELLQRIMLEDDDGDTIWHIAVHSRSSNAIVIFKELEKLNNETAGNSAKTMDALKSFMLKKGNHGRNVLMTAIVKKDFETYRYIFDDIFLIFSSFKEFVYETDDNGYNILHHLIDIENLPMIEHFFSFAKSKLSADEFKSFLKTRTSGSQHIFNIMGKNLNKPNLNTDSIKFVLNFLAGVFTSDEMRDFLYEINPSEKSALSLLYEVITCGSEMYPPDKVEVVKDIFQFIYEFYERFFSKMELMKMIKLMTMKKDDKGLKIPEFLKNDELKNLIEEITNKLASDVQNSTLAIFEKYLDNNTLFYHLMHPQDYEKSTIFHEIARAFNFELEFFSKFWQKIKERNFSYSKVSKMFLTVDTGEKIFFNYLAEGDSYQENFENFDAVINLIKESLDPQDQKKIFERASLIFFAKALLKGKELAFYKVLSFYKSIMSPSEIVANMVEDRDEHGNTVFHIVALHSVTGDISGALRAIFETFKEANEKLGCYTAENMKKFLFSGGQPISNVPLIVAMGGNIENFRYIFDEVYLKFSTFKEFAYPADLDELTVFHMLANEGNIEMMKYFLDRAKIEFSETELKYFLRIKAKKTINIFHFLGNLKDKKETVEYILEFYSQTFSTPEMREMLLEVDDVNDLPLHNSVRSNSVETFKCFYNCYLNKFTKAEVQKLFYKKGDHDKNVLELAEHTNFTDFIGDMLQELTIGVVTIFEKFRLYTENHDLFIALMEGGEDERPIVEIFQFSFEIFKLFWAKIEARKFDRDEIRWLINAEDKNGKNFLYYLLETLSKKEAEASEKISWTINFLERNLKVHDQKTFFKKTPFTTFGKVRNEQVFTTIIMYMKRILTSRDILQSLTSEDEKGQTIMHIAAVWSTPEILSLILSEFEVLVERNEGSVKNFILKKAHHYYGLTPLMLSIVVQEHNNFCFLLDKISSRFLDFQTIVKEADVKGKNILHYLAEWGSLSMIKLFLQKVQENFSVGDLKNFLKLKANTGENIFHMIMKNKSNPESVAYLIKFLSETLTRVEMRELLVEVDCDKGLCLHDSARVGRLIIFYFIFKCYLTFFEKTELIELLNMQDINGKNVLGQVKNDLMKDFLKKLFDATFENLGETDETSEPPNKRIKLND